MTPEEIATAAWAPYKRIRAAPTPKGEWVAIVHGIAELAALDAAQPGHDVVLHKRLNLLTEGLELLASNPAVASAAVRKQKRLAFAASCIALVPPTFPINTPFGSSCVEAWCLGHQTFATHSPSRVATWAPCLAELAEAEERYRQAPRTQYAGKLKNGKTIEALIAIGNTMPWIGEARAIAP